MLMSRSLTTYWLIALLCWWADHWLHTDWLPCYVDEQIIDYILIDCLVMLSQVKGMGMDSPELLLFVENCPKGAETLVTRVIHILTDKGRWTLDSVRRIFIQLFKLIDKMKLQLCSVIYQKNTELTYIQRHKL